MRDTASLSLAVTQPPLFLEKLNKQPTFVEMADIFYNKRLC
jgi:hypothetical protein